MCVCTQYWQARVRPHLHPSCTGHPQHAVSMLVSHVSDIHLVVHCCDLNGLQTCNHAAFDVPNEWAAVDFDDWQSVQECCMMYAFVWQLCQPTLHGSSLCCLLHLEYGQSLCSLSWFRFLCSKNRAEYMVYVKSYLCNAGLGSLCIQFGRCGGTEANLTTHDE